MTNLFGPMVDTSDVETAVLSTIEYWIDSYLAQKERAKGWQVGMLARPRSYQATFDYENWPEGQLPNVTVVCPGTAEDALYYNAAGVGAWFEVNVDVILEDSREPLARRNAAVYQSALTALLAQQAELMGSGSTPFASEVRFLNWGLDLPDVDNRTLVVGTSEFHILVSDVFDPSTRPHPPPPGQTDPGTGPDAETTNPTFDAVRVVDPIDS